MCVDMFTLCMSLPQYFGYNATFKSSLNQLKAIMFFVVHRSCSSLKPEGNKHDKTLRNSNTFVAVLW